MDFLVDGKFTFEIGGKNKDMGQLSNVENAWVVKDEIEYPVGKSLPLWLSVLEESILQIRQKSIFDISTICRKKPFLSKITPSLLQNSREFTPSLLQNIL